MSCKPFYSEVNLDLKATAKSATESLENCQRKAYRITLEFYPIIRIELTQNDFINYMTEYIEEVGL
jgi:hypothetical protein